MSLSVVFFGTPQFAVPCLETLLGDERFRVLGVVTQPDKPRGRGNQLSPSPVKALALQQDLPLWQPDRIKKDPETLAALATLQADAFVVVAYGQLLSPQILAMPRLGCVNVHASLLPAYRGAAPIQWAVVHGQPETGVTTMLMDAGMDTGAMLLKATLAIPPEENAQTIASQLSALGAGLIAPTLLQLDAGVLQPQPQDPDQATYAPLIQKSIYAIDWTQSAQAIHNHVRGFYPNANTSFRGQPLKILKTRLLAADDVLAGMPAAALADDAALVDDAALAVGTIVALPKALGPVVQTGQGCLLLEGVQPAGKRVQSGLEFANGVRLAVGDRLSPML
jgi:methionyl-tRNA formyltransferase